LILQAIKANVLSQLREGRELLAASNVKSEALALVIDGKSLTYALEDDVKDLFLAFAVGCASVICCRSSPKQKALVCFLCVFIIARYSYPLFISL
jgi:phospholipid-translocating ATPase